MPSKTSRRRAVVITPNGQRIIGGESIVKLYCGLQTKGMELRAKNDGILNVQSPDELTPSVSSQLRRHKQDLLALIRSEAVCH